MCLFYVVSFYSIITSELRAKFCSLDGIRSETRKFLPKLQIFVDYFVRFSNKTGESYTKFGAETHKLMKTSSKIFLKQGRNC